MRIFFLRDPKNFPVACVASEIVELGVDKSIEFAIACYNPDYPCDKKMAKAVAIGRLHAKMAKASGKRRKLKELTGSVIAAGNIKLHIMQWIEANPSQRIHSHVRAAAEFWLAHPELREHNERQDMERLENEGGRVHGTA